MTPPIDLTEASAVAASLQYHSRSESFVRSLIVALGPDIYLTIFHWIVLISIAD